MRILSSLRTRDAIRMRTNLTPSTDLLKAVRAQLILRDSSLSAWAEQNGVKRQNLRKALVGEWRGPKASKLVARVVNDLLRDAA